MRIGCYYDDGRALVAALDKVAGLTGLTEYAIRKAINEGVPIPGAILTVVPKDTPERIPKNCGLQSLRIRRKGG